MKFKRAFAPVDNAKFDKTALNEVAEKIIFVCPVPMFDDIKDRTDLFERYIERHLKEFDIETDVIADFGDSMIFAMMAFYLGAMFGQMNVARYNRRNDSYTIRYVDADSPDWGVINVEFIGEKK